MSFRNSYTFRGAAAMAAYEAFAGGQTTAKPNVHKCLSVGQPYADRLVTGAKPVENRTWQMRYRGRLLIHAGRTTAWLDSGQRKEDFALGAIVGTVDVVDCVRADYIESPAGRDRFRWIPDTDADHGGPWCIVVKNPYRFAEPIPYRGQLGLFEVPDHVVAHALVQPPPAARPPRSDAEILADANFRARERARLQADFARGAR